MKRSNLSVAMAHLVMESISELQKSRQRSALKDIKSHIYDKYGSRSEKFMRLIPQYVTKGVNLGLIARYGDNFRTKMYVARRGRRRRGGKRRRRRRRR